MWRSCATDAIECGEERREGGTAQPVHQACAWEGKDLRRDYFLSAPVGWEAGADQAGLYLLNLFRPCLGTHGLRQALAGELSLYVPTKILILYCVQATSLKSSQF
eukprot:358445-Chlamydomonas_euryale.AAC.3